MPLNARSDELKKALLTAPDAAPICAFPAARSSGQAAVFFENSADEALATAFCGVT
jgi:DTW domain-containing protein YfiP